MNNFKKYPLALALNLTLRILNLTLTLRVLALNLTLTLRVLVLVLNIAQGGQYLSHLSRHLSQLLRHLSLLLRHLSRHLSLLLRHLSRHLSQLLRHLRVVCSHDAFQICNPLPDIADWYNPSTRYKYIRGIFTEVVIDAGVGDGDHQISDLVIPF